MSTLQLDRPVTSEDRLDAMISIDLEQLTEVAALQTRIDRKYVVPAPALDSVLDRLPDATAVLEIDGLRAHRYHSVYFDSPDLDSYLSAGRSRRQRWKLRTRSYLDSGATFLELKTRGARGLTVKERIAHPDGSAGLNAEGIAYAAQAVGVDLAEQLVPTLTTAYTRSTFLLPDSGARATIDTGLTFGAVASRSELALPEKVIIESKSGSSPSEIDRVLWRMRYRPVSISKYGAGMAALDPSLPRLKWHRVLAHDLGIERNTTR